jgi:hypothetical protein
MTTTQVPTPSADAASSERPQVDVDEPVVTRVAKALTADERLGRAFIQGTIVGTVLVFVFCGGISLLAGLGVAPAIGIGAFTALFGGPGFGGMMGATIYYSSHSEDF